MTAPRSATAAPASRLLAIWSLFMAPARTWRTRPWSPCPGAGSSAWSPPSGSSSPPAARQLTARHQDQLPPVTAVHLGHRPAVLTLAPLELLAQIPVLGLEPGYPLLEVEYLLDPSEVHPHLLRQLLNVAPELDVLLGVQPRVLYALARAEQTLLLVHPQRLRMHPDELRGDPDHEHRPLAQLHDPTFLNSSSLTSSSLSSARASSISRSRLFSFLGTTSRARTMRSPRSPLRARAFGAPASRTLNCLPSCVPAGNLHLTVPPPGRGTCI